MGKKDFYRQLNVAKGYKKGLIILSIVEIVLGLTAIGLAVPTIVLARQNYRDCYDSLVAGGSSCNLYERLNTYSHTSQGIWEGVLWSYMNGFSLLSSALSGTMIVFEALAVSDYTTGGYERRYASDYPLWCLHVTLLSLACVIWLVTSAKRAAISKICAWGKVEVIDDGVPTEPPQPAVYTASE